MEGDADIVIVTKLTVIATSGLPAAVNRKVCGVVGQELPAMATVYAREVVDELSVAPPDGVTVTGTLPRLVPTAIVLEPVGTVTGLIVREAVEEFAPAGAQ